MIFEMIETLKPLCGYYRWRLVMSTPFSTTHVQSGLPSRRSQKTIPENLLLVAMRLLGPRRGQSLCIALSALRSCHGHLCTAIREGRYLLETGEPSDLNGASNPRTLARTVSIKNRKYVLYAKGGAKQV